MTDEKEMRQVLANTLAEIANTDKRIVVLEADLMGCHATKAFKEAHPDRFVNVGIAEANMIGIAAGMSAMGKIPFAYSFAPFATRRCYDTIFISVAYAKQHVKIVGSDPGIMAEANGGTHMPFEDMAIMRAIPQIIDYPGAVYIRLFRKKPEHIFDDVPDFKLGKAITVKAGKDVTLVASGIMVEKALKAAEILKEEGIDAGVLNIHTWKPIDEEAIVNAVKKTGALVTCENHTLQGGLGSAVSEVVVSKCPAPVGMIGVNNTFGEVGKKEYLAEKFHLTVEDIVNKAKETIALKK